MISFFGLQEGPNQNKTARRMTAVKYTPDSLVYGTLYGNIATSIDFLAY